VLGKIGVHKDHHGFTNALYTLYELLYLLTPESDHHGFANHGGHSLVLVNTGVHKVHRERW
jgi:hypothetical protein